MYYIHRYILHILIHFHLFLYRCIFMCIHESRCVHVGAVDEMYMDADGDARLCFPRIDDPTSRDRESEEREYI